MNAAKFFAPMALVALMAGQAQAQVITCVDTVEEFDAAYQQAEDEDVVIRVVRGEYQMASSCISSIDNQFRCQNIDEAITIRGGYAPGCGSRVLDPAQTIFRGSSPVAGNSNSFRMSTRDPIVLESITLQNGREFEIEVEDNTSPDSTLTLNRVWFHNMGPLIFDRGAEFYVYNSLFSRSIGDCAVKVGTSANNSLVELASLTHVTIANAANQSLCVGQALLSGPGDIRVRLRNSIFWKPGGVDAVVLRQIGVIDAIMSNNTWTGISVVPSLSQAATGTLTSDPQFLNPTGTPPSIGNYELTGASGSINSGQLLANSSSDFDIQGNARVFSTAPDRGALESNIGSTATTITVTSAADSGVNTLRQALFDANQTPALNRIRFNIPGACPRVINLLSPLPTIDSNVQIEGYSQPGSVRNSLASGSNAELCVILHSVTGGSAIAGLSAATDIDPSLSVDIDGLGFSGFLLGAVNFFGGQNHRLNGSQIGGLINGYAALPNGYGVRIGSGAREVQIGGAAVADRNVIAETTEVGVQLLGSESLIEGNLIGTNPSGNSARPNAIGVEVRGGGFNRIIGNVISASQASGLEIDDSNNNTVQRNRIGTNALCVLGSCDLGNGDDGIWIHGAGADNNGISDNLIVFNGEDGIAIDSGATGNVITNNQMYDNTGQGIDLGANGLNPIDEDYAAQPAIAGNRNQNAARILTAISNNSIAYVSGDLSTRNGQYRINFFAENECPSPIFNDTMQGRIPLNSTVVTVSGGNPALQTNGTAVFRNVLVFRSNDRAFFATDRRLVAVVTRLADNDTSEFSRCVSVRNELIFLDDFE